MSANAGQADERLRSALEAIETKLLALARLEPGPPLATRGRGDALDGIAAGLNMLDEELQAAVAENERLRRLAEAASQAKSRLLAQTSHELRTPLNGILGMGRLLLETELDSQQRGFARVVVASGEALLQIVNDIMDLSRAEAGRLQLEPAAFEPALLVHEACQLLSVAAADKGIALTQDIDGAVAGRLRADPGRIRQVLVNLIGNAVKYTERGAVLVKLRSRELDDGRVGLRFEVRDTGAGIPEQQLEQLFEPYGREKTAQQSQVEGTGLGLAIARQLVELMGGAIGAVNHDGRGATFWFEVPCHPG
mgnify:CR=1 FL=1